MSTTFGTFLLLTLVATLAFVAGHALGFLRGQQQARREHGDLHAELQTLSAEAVNDSSRQVFQLAESGIRATEQVVSPVRDSLDRLNRRIGDLESQSAAWQAQLREQVESVRLSGTELRRETATLAEALRRPQVRGNWGEMQLRRSLELAGVTQRCVFDEQVTRRTDDGPLRPDVIVQLPGSKQVVVDSKVSLDAFLAATGATDAVDREAALVRHARQVKQHIDALAGKAYWQQFSPTPEFVVMFIPGEAIFAQALETDPTLLDHAAAKRVMLATPTTLIAMLKTIAYAWSQDAVAQNAREVQQLGRELYERLGKLGAGLDRLGRSLATSVGHYNKAIGSLESRVLVSARRLRDLDVVDDELTGAEPVTDTPRPLVAPELLRDLEPAVESAGIEAALIEGPPGREQFRRRAAGE
jgi:DNA recombination protein RmuC